MTADLANNPQVCAALREEIELYHSKRVEILDNKTKIKIVRRKGIPSIMVLFMPFYSHMNNSKDIFNSPNHAHFKMSLKLFF